VEHPTRKRKHPQASDLKGTRWAVLKNPGDLTGEQRTTIATIAKTNNRLYRAYLLKEQLRAVFAARGKPVYRAINRNWHADLPFLTLTRSRSMR
jgi:transposase